MKILISTAEHIADGEQYRDDKGWGFGEAFKKQGHEVSYFFHLKRGRLAFLEKNKRIQNVWWWYTNRALYRHVLATRPDVLFIVSGKTIEAETLRRIRRETDTVIINLFTDNPVLMGKFDAIEPCHLYLVKDTYVTGLLHRAGLKNVHYLPQCTNHHVYRPMDMSADEAALHKTDITLIGSMYPYRRRFMEEIADLQPVIWGRGWKRSKNAHLKANYRGRDIRGTEKTLAMNGAAININLHHPLNDIFGTNSRTFDISACRSFQLADYKSDMEDLLKVGEEIICFKDADEFRKLARYYLDHPDERADIAARAYDRTLKEHTYESRAATVLDMTGSLKA